MRGKVRWFSDKRGYGFISSRKMEKDIFVHFSEVKMDGYKTLNEGDYVEFDYDSRNNKAINLRVIDKRKVMM